MKKEFVNSSLKGKFCMDSVQKYQGKSVTIKFVLWISNHLTSAQQPIKNIKALFILLNFSICILFIKYLQLKPIPKFPDLKKDED